MTHAGFENLIKDELASLSLKDLKLLASELLIHLNGDYLGNSSNMAKFHNKMYNVFPVIDTLSLIKEALTKEIVKRFIENE